MCLVIFDNALAMIRAWIAGFVGRTLLVACLTNPARLAAALGVCVSNDLALAVIGADVVNLVSRAGKEAVLALEAIVAAAFGLDTRLVEGTLAVIRAWPEVTTSARAWH